MRHSNHDRDRGNRDDLRYFTVRFCDDTDRLVRRRFRYHGDLSEAVGRSLTRLDETLPIYNMRLRANGVRRVIKAPTQIGLPKALYLKCREFCKQRACSMNALINSAILFYYGRQEIAV